MIFLKILTIPLLIIVAPILFKYNLASSYALGIFISCLFLICCSFFNSTIIFKFNVNCNLIICQILIILFLLFHKSLSGLIFKIDSNVYKFTFSTFLLILVFLSSYILKNMLLNFNKFEFKSTLIFLIALLLLNSFFSYFTNYTKYGFNNKSIGIFPEISHFALAIAIPLVFFSATHKKISFIIIIWLLFFAYEIKNLTLVLVCFFSFIILIKINFFRFFLILLSLTPIALFIINNEYFYNRLFLQEDNPNISLLVILRGWENVLISIDKSYFLGYGFQNFDAIGTNGYYSSILKNIGLEYLNISDAGSTAAKILGEMGLFGLLILLFYFYKFQQSIKYLMFNQHIKNDFKNTFFAACIVCLVFELFIRGIGYFSPGIFLGIVGIIGFRSPQSSINKKPICRVPDGCIHS